jgi:peptide/nickel transport system permease protein
LIHKNKWLCIQILLLLVLALFSDFIANENPILIRKDGKLSSPIFSPAKYRLNDDSELIIIPPIPYSPNTLDYKNAKSIGPFYQQYVNSYRYRYWLGTDELGRDILSGVIHGTSMALIVGIGSMLIASLIRISLGSLAGFFGNDQLKIGPITIFFSIIGLMIGYLLSFHQTIYFNDANTLDISINQIFNLLIFISCTYVFSYIGQ